MTHEDYMGICIDLAHKAAKNGDVPVGALIVKDNKIIAKGYNQKEKTAFCFYGERKKSC